MKQVFPLTNQITLDTFVGYANVIMLNGLLYFLQVKILRKKLHIQKYIYIFANFLLVILLKTFYEEKLNMLSAW